MLARERSNKSVVTRFQDSVAAAGGQPHNLGSFPVTTSQESKREGRPTPALQLQLGTAMKNGVDFSKSFWQSVTAAVHLAKNAGLKSRKLITSMYGGNAQALLQIAQSA